MSDDHPLISSVRGAELAVHRLRLPTAGALRHIQVHLDGHGVADLAREDTVHLSTTAGPHRLQARRPPLRGGEHTFILAADEILHASIYVSVFEEIEIQLDEQPPRPGTVRAVRDCPVGGVALWGGAARAERSQADGQWFGGGRPSIDALFFWASILTCGPSESRNV